MLKKAVISFIIQFTGSIFDFLLQNKPIILAPLDLDFLSIIVENYLLNILI